MTFPPRVALNNFVGFLVCNMKYNHISNSPSVISQNEVDDSRANDSNTSASIPCIVFLIIVMYMYYYHYDIKRIY